MDNNFHDRMAGFAMGSPGFGGSYSTWCEVNTKWRYIVEYFTDDHSPWDRGVQDAHWISCGTTQQIDGHLSRAKRGRLGLLARVLPWRRRYLGGLIWALQVELDRRARVDEM